MPVDDKFASIE